MSEISSGVVTTALDVEPLEDDAKMQLTLLLISEVREVLQISERTTVSTSTVFSSTGLVIISSKFTSLQFPLFPGLFQIQCPGNLPGNLSCNSEVLKCSCLF